MKDFSYKQEFSLPNGQKLTARCRIPPYEGMKADRTPKPLGKREVELELQRRCVQCAQYEKTAEEAKRGDMVNLDFLGLLEGVPFDDGKTEGFDLQLGSNTFVKGFEEQIMGRRAGEHFEITVTFPDPYPAQELAGKEAVFQIALNEVRRLVVPQPSEEIAARAGYPSLAAMTDAVREQRLALHRKKREEEVKAELLKQLVQETEREIPEELFSDAAGSLRSHLLAQLRAGGQNLALYLKRNALSEEELEQQLRERASDAVTKQMVVDAIARREQLLPTEEEIEAEHQRFLERTKRPDSPRLKTLVKERLCCERVEQHLLEHSAEG